MSLTSRFASIRNGDSVDFSKVPVVPIEDFRSSILKMAAAKHRLCALFSQATDDRAPAGLLAVLADDIGGRLYLAASQPAASYPTLTPELPQAHLFEREIHESSGVLPEGHPWLKPVRRALADKTPFFQEQGEEVHEVAVGPIHAGIIEPGHFRFQCHGETVHHLEIQLGYQHRGAERLLSAGPDRRSMAVAESICGDTAIAHAWAHCMIREALAGASVSLRDEALRAVVLEVERLSNHIGDLGAISNDIGYLPATAYFGRMRGDFLNMLMLVSGNRYGKGMLQPGGAAFDIPDGMRAQMIETVRRSVTQVKEVADMFFGEPSVISRLEETGTVSMKVCEDLGLVGVCARAAGLDRDVRQDHPFGLYRFRHIPVIKLDSGDVFARAMVRFLEAQRSLEFLNALLENLPEASAGSPCGTPAGNRLSVSLIEGWRGEVCHVAKTGRDGRFEWYKVIDPSFHNWIGLAMALRGGEISDFPLSNKSFNLSYAGHDL
ncbi:MAG: hydrogenase [Elusimicrobia bacterium CG_4_9_14_3_um_filter_62_55]|nr:MAG: hydrogenase [Elusimicrobia bacterium CG22_combo_CG10-13_8_21_14_all_63_91]PJB25229.1 MAG: hydrogenase [Elusimicrobia bacterium CG_4_9_14_3_um_filter_62_55]